VNTFVKWVIGLGFRFHRCVFHFSIGTFSKKYFQKKGGVPYPIFTKCIYLCRVFQKLEFKVLYFGQCILRENIRHIGDFTDN